MNGRQWSELGWLYGAKIAALLANVLVYRLASDYLGAEGFAEYSIARRTISFVMPAMLMGQLVALPRQLALHSRDRWRMQSLFVASLLTVLSVAVVIGIVVVVAPGPIGSLCFGDDDHAGLLWPMMMFMVGQSLFFLVSGYFQGCLEFRIFGIIGITCGGLLPVVGFWAAPARAGAVLTISAGLIAITAMLYTALALRRSGVPRVSLPFRELLEYGIPRMPGDFAMGGMLGLPSILVANQVGLVEGGWVAFAGTMMSMVITAVAPFSTAWLPRLTRCLADGSSTDIIGQIRRSVLTITAIVTVGVIVGIYAMRWIVTWYLGPEFLPAVPVLRLFALGAIPFSIYGLLRSVVDAAYKKPINAMAVSVALVGFFGLNLLLGFWMSPLWSVVIAAVVSYVLMAGLCTVASWRALRPGFKFET